VLQGAFLWLLAKLVSQGAVHFIFEAPDTMRFLTLGRRLNCRQSQ
jgi:hypothetical protein